MHLQHEEYSSSTKKREEQEKMKAVQETSNNTENHTTNSQEKAPTTQINRSRCYMSKTRFKIPNNRWGSKTKQRINKKD